MYCELGIKFEPSTCIIFWNINSIDLTRRISRQYVIKLNGAVRPTLCNMATFFDKSNECCFVIFK